MTEVHLCSQIRRADQALAARHEAVLRGFGLTMAQYMVLLHLSEATSMSGAQLARASGVTPQTMAPMLATLREKGLIAREPSAVHGKVMIASLTGEGRAVLERAHQQVVVLEEAFYAAFSPAERVTLAGLLERAAAVLAEQAAAHRSA
ncbi:MarR family transcriptional regulator [Longispora fulva]|uniref:DNA-binding MarR family transcriptional regulator n=1 Tax=Longispora fulva TaxID=619741 RepID=A0A8J7H4K1_9ACTN|nr:MarR family transcriptional regulator [Longispora fulva]MBG6141388.1 DNA-binding MarR family transcriptional regulator [Longispora fulva]GIG59462.1 MarR family transcriptional regulator [Longispora fulva]